MTFIGSVYIVLIYDVIFKCVAYLMRLIEAGLANSGGLSR